MPKSLTNEELDRAARGALQPNQVAGAAYSPLRRSLSRLLKERRSALGLYKPRGKKVGSRPAGIHALRRLRADMGDAQWKTLLKRVDKHAAFLAKKSAFSDANRI